jgi:hypothetical protein
MKQEINYIGQADDKQLTAWKAKHGQVFVFEQIDAKDENTLHVTYVKKPNLTQIQRAINVAEDDMIKTGITLLNDCHLGGSEKVMENEELKLGVSSLMPGLFKKVTATLKEV